MEPCSWLADVKTPPNSLGIEPLLKWPGGKRWLADDLVKMISPRAKRYYEPFAGGAALFFRLQPPSAVLSDQNEELVNCYTQVRDHPDRVIAKLRILNNSEEDYYRVRASRPRSDVARAARIIYLTTLAFNGIYRVNLKGEFNVPYGRKEHLTACEPDRLRAASRALQNTTLKVADFESAVEQATAGDVIYFDPPYTVAHGNNGFVKYNEKILQWADQVRLANLAARCSRKGCKVIVSNADHPSILALYKGFKLCRVSRASVMAASLKFRREITECVFHN